MAWLHAILGAMRRPAKTGPDGERLAAEHLERLGYRILARNLRNRFGEIDLLAEAPDRRTIVVVEVKAADADSALPPEFRVGIHKQRKLVGLACQVARRYRLTDRPIRFDVIGVNLPAPASPATPATPGNPASPGTPGRPAQVRHYPHAFESHL